ncbi:MAG: hypothetical protein IPO92_10685 [Saprospiraceae bacterium]|nr:hypothetical protein [Saprospiraceae bacterium]
MNEKTRTFTVIATFVKKPEVLYPNLSVEANIILNKKEKTMTIPSSYITDDTYVMLKDGSKKRVVIGLKDYQFVEITGGIDATTEIILPK